MHIKFAGVFLACSIFLANSHASFLDSIDIPSTPSALVKNTRLMGVASFGNKLIAVGPKGHIIHSKNNGSDWTQSEVPVSSDLVAVKWVNEDVAWAVGHDSVILKTQDGGETWIKKIDARLISELPIADTSATKISLDGDSLPLLDIYFLNQKEGYAVGAFNLALKTIDGGESWERIDHLMNNPEGLHLYAIGGDAEHIWIVGEQGLILQKPINSEYFNRLESPYQGSFFSLANGENGLMVYGMRGNVFYFDKAKRIWEKINIPVAESINASAFKDGEYFFVTQGGKVFRYLEDNFKLIDVNVENSMPFYGVAVNSIGQVALVGAAGAFVTQSNK